LLRSYLHLNNTFIKTNGPSLGNCKGSNILPDIVEQWAETYFLNDVFLFQAFVVLMEGRGAAGGTDTKNYGILVMTETTAMKSSFLPMP
jgi:hypothetical protein